jgi:RecA/RadA recombinase
MNRNLAIFLIFIMKLKSVKADAQRPKLYVGRTALDVLLGTGDD